MEAGAFRTASLEKTSHEAVFVHQHQTRPEHLESYKLITEEFLPEDFFHPAYLILFPDGREADPANRHCHEALSAGQIGKMIEDVAKAWGKGLTEKQYATSKAELEAAERSLAEGKPEEAIPRLEPLAKLKARCGIRDRAVAFLDLIGATGKLREEAAAVSEAAAARLAAADLVGAWRAVRTEDGEAAEALDAKLLGEIRKFVRLSPLRLDRLLLSTGTLWYLRAEWATDVPAFDGLVLQLAYVNDVPKSFEGFATFDRVEPCRRHRAAFSMASRDFRLHDPVNARAQLWLDRVLLCEVQVAAKPDVYPLEDSHVLVGPDLLEDSDTLGAHVRAVRRAYRLGRYVGNP